MTTAKFRVWADGLEYTLTSEIFETAADLINGFERLHNGTTPLWIEVDRDNLKNWILWSRISRIQIMGQNEPF